MCVREGILCLSTTTQLYTCLGVESTRKMRWIYRLGRSATFLHATELLVSSAGLFGRSSLQEEKVVNVNNRRCVAQCFHKDLGMGWGWHASSSVWCRMASHIRDCSSNAPALHGVLYNQNKLRPVYLVCSTTTYTCWLRTNDSIMEQICTVASLKWLDSIRLAEN